MNAHLSLAPWLQPGDRIGRRGSSRFNGFPAGRQTVETVQQMFAAIFHQAKATVLMKGVPSPQRLGPCFECASILQDQLMRQDIKD